MPNWERWKNIMKCYPLEEWRLNKWDSPYIVQIKYDGFRSRAIPLPNGGYMLLSSAENVFFSVPHINEYLSQGYYQGVELDGELYNHQIYLEGGFDAISSILSRTKNLHPDYHKIQFHVFDYVDDKPQMVRSVNLDKLLERSGGCLQKAPYWVCNSLEEIMELYDEFINLGYEGIIVRNAFAPYVRKRSTYIMKFKPKQKDDYIIIGSEEGRDRLEGTLGTLVCASGDGETFNVGSGFSDSLRNDLWANRDSLPGKVCRVKYQHITTGRKVPRFGVHKEILK